jgi:dTDP-4-dehydrorhamnose reductase
MAVKRILITGANGQLGRSLRDASESLLGTEFLFLGRADLDITRPDQIAGWFSKFKPDYCINCAAYTHVDQAEKSPQTAYEINAKGVENLAKACRDLRVILIHVSTDYVFDGKKTEGYTPGDLPNPINVYGKTKLEGEHRIQRELSTYFIIRTSWLYSRKYRPNFYLTILDRAKKGEPLSITDSQTGCPTDASNLARHILEMIQSGNRDYGISHFTDGQVMTWFEFAHRILAEEGFPEYAHLKKVENYRTFAVRPENSILLP